MRRLIYLATVLLSLSIAQSSAAQSPDPRDLTQAVEATVRQALSRLAYNELWALWEMACPAERARTSAARVQEDINQYRYRLTGGQPFPLQTRISSPEYAVVTTTVRVEDRLDRIEWESERRFHVQYDPADQRWCVSLVEFVNLTQYRQ